MSWHGEGWAGSKPDKVGEEIKDAGEDGGDRSIEQGDDVHHVLQALRACLIQPCVNLCPALLCCERGGVRHLCHDSRCPIGFFLYYGSEGDIHEKMSGL